MEHLKHLCVCVSVLEELVEALSSGQTVKKPRPQLTILQDYEQILERYDDYEDDTGELRAENTLTEKFSKIPSDSLLYHCCDFIYCRIIFIIM